jgi:DNA-binding transcriptional ArsR family regulator
VRYKGREPMRRDVFQAIVDPNRRAILALLSQQKLTLNGVAENFRIIRQMGLSSGLRTWRRVRRAIKIILNPIVPRIMIIINLP